MRPTAIRPVHATRASRLQARSASQTPPKLHQRPADFVAKAGLALLVVDGLSAAEEAAATGRGGSGGGGSGVGVAASASERHGLSDFES